MVRTVLITVLISISRHLKGFISAVTVAPYGRWGSWGVGT